MKGILVVDKPQGFTSFDVVAKLRGICGTRRIGHSGTLDPMATGVLPVFIGPVVKAVDLQPRHDKSYEAEFLFGLETDTGDITGSETARGNANISPEALCRVLASFEGEGEQIPPMVSAVKVNGKPLYKYAREGITLGRKPRPITIHSARCAAQAGPGRFVIQVHCSRGTYIRVLAQDVAHAMGTCATLSALRRTAAGVFTLADAHTLEAIQAAKDGGHLESLLLPADRLFEDLPPLQVDEIAEKRLLSGAPVYGIHAGAGRCRLYGSSGFLGLGRVETGVLNSIKLFVERG